jgi:hypothetical protein
VDDIALIRTELGYWDGTGFTEDQSKAVAYGVEDEEECWAQVDRLKAMGRRAWTDYFPDRLRRKSVSSKSATQSGASEDPSQRRK